MATLNIQQAIEKAKADPSSDFAKQIRKMIESGQLDNFAAQQGVDLTPYGRPAPKQGFDTSMLGDRPITGLGLQTPGRTKETMEDIKQIGQGVGDSFERRMDKIQGIQESDVSGVRKATQTFGQGLGLFQDLLGEGIKGFTKLALNPEQEQAVKNAAGEVIGGISQTAPVKAIVDEYQRIEQENPALARDIDTAFNTVMTALDVYGFGVASTARKAAKTAGKKVATETTEQVAKQTPDLAKTAIKDIAEGAIPTSNRLVNSTINKAFDLTQGDVKNIAKSTGNEPGQWVAKNNLIRGNIDETRNAIEEFGSEAMRVRDAEISKVSKTFNPAEFPRYKDSLTEVVKQLEGKTGFENTLAEAKTLLGKSSITLSDAQRAKELMDEAFNLYKITGDVSESTTKAGLANVRKELRKAIEEEVKLATDGAVDIFQLNNDIATARSLGKAIESRLTRDLTRANLQWGDYATFAGASVAGGPIIGLAAFLARKSMQNPAVMLRLAKFLDGLSDARRAKIKASIEAGDIPTEIINKLDEVAEPDIVSKIAKPVIDKTKEFIDNPKMGLSIEDVSKNIPDDLIQEARKYKSVNEFVNKVENATEGIGSIGKIADSFSYKKVDITPKGNTTLANISLGNDGKYFEMADGFADKAKVLKDLEGNIFAYLKEGTNPEKLSKKTRAFMVNNNEPWNAGQPKKYITTDNGKTWLEISAFELGSATSGMSKSQLEEIWKEANKN